MIRVLFLNETLKTVKDLSFWVTLIGGAFIVAMGSGVQWYNASRNENLSYALPDAWTNILSNSSTIILVFGTVAVILLVANEFTWRTARQSVIDGLSKDQFFAGKLLLVPMLGVAFILVQVLIGVGFAIPGTDFSALDGPIIRTSHLSLLGGVFLSFLGMASLALFIALAVRSGGAALGVWFFYSVLGEDLIGSIGTQIDERFERVADFLPISVFGQLNEFTQHDAAAYVRAVERATESGRPPPELWDWSVLLGWTGIWMAVVIVGGLIWFRKRDL